MPRWITLALLALCLAGCAKPDLPSRVVRAASAGELADFRTELSAEFSADRLQPFDTALQELRLDAMHRDVAPADAREEDMRAVVNGKTVQQVLVAGWKARRDRLRREMALINELLTRDQKAAQRTAASGTPQSVANAIQNEQDILARLQGDLRATEQRLAGWNVSGN